MAKKDKTHQTSLHVLIVDNDPQWQVDHLNNLTKWGYDACAAQPAKDASDRFQALWDDAITKAKNHHYHLALVDMRLKKDDDTSDTSGLDLIPHMAPTVSIIVSGYGDAKTVRAALKSPLEVPKRAYDFVGKEDGPEVLQAVIDEVAQRIWHWRKVEIVWPDGLTSTEMASQLRPTNSNILADQVEDLLRRLFPNAKKLRIETMFHSNVRSDCTPGMKFRIWQDDDHLPKLLRLGEPQSIEQEFNNYKQFVASNLIGLKAVEVASHDVLWDIGGIVYDVNSEVRPFDVAFRELEGKQIEAVLDSLIVKLNPWRDKPRLVDAFLFDEYLAEYEDTLNSLPVNSDLPSIDSQLPSPVAWVLQHKEHGRFFDVRQVICHGDLCAENILVDKRRNDVDLWNFQNTGPGHEWRDFAALEVSILVHLTDGVDQVYDELALAATQFSPDPERILWTPRIYFNPLAKKVLDAIFKIRTLARETTRYLDPYEYGWALLLTAVRYLAVNTDTVDQHFTRAWQLGSAICQWLEQQPTKEGYDMALWLSQTKTNVTWFTDKDLARRQERSADLERRRQLLDLERGNYRPDSRPYIALTERIMEIDSELKRLGCIQSELTPQTSEVAG